MTESIYFATSENYPGQVKIGRTDRPVEDRMQELSAQDYGLEGEDGNVTWEAERVLVVEDNAEAERILHDHFDAYRVSPDREIFQSEDLEAMAEEAAAAVDGTLLSDVDDPEVFAEALDTLIEYSLMFGAGAFIGRSLHKKLSGNPRYESALAKAQIYSEQVVEQASVLQESAARHWDQSRLFRDEVATNLKAQWEASKPKRNEILGGAMPTGRQVTRGGASVLTRLKSKFAQLRAEQAGKRKGS